MVARYNFFPGIGKVDNRDDYSYSDCGFFDFLADLRLRIQT